MNQGLKKSTDAIVLQICTRSSKYVIKNVYFLSADEIVQKINNILDARVSSVRSEYLASKQRKNSERTKRH